MSQSLSFGPEWMRSKKSQDKSSSTGSSEWGIAGSMASKLSKNGTRPSETGSRPGVGGPRSLQSAISGGSPPSNEPQQPVVKNEGGKKYSPSEMLEIWQQMNDSNRFRSSGRPRSDLYYSVLPNQPVNITEKSKPSDDSVTSTGNESTTEPATGAASTTTSTTTTEPSLNDLLPTSLPIGSSVTSATTNGNGSSSSPWNAFANVVPRPGLSHSGSSSDLSIPGTTTNTNSRLFDGFQQSSTPTPPPPPPPGIALQPEQINWMYKDSAGMEYGPFNGRNMHDWFVGGWLHETLMIRRSEEQEYTTLKSFIDRVNNPREPFLVPLSVITAAGGIAPPPPGATSSRQPDPFGQFRQPQQNPQPLANQFGGLQLQSPGWLPSPMSPWSQAQTPFFGQPHPAPQQQPQTGQSTVMGAFNGIAQPSDPVWNGAGNNNTSSNGTPDLEPIQPIASPKVSLSPTPAEQSIREVPPSQEEQAVSEPPVERSPEQRSIEPAQPTEPVGKTTASKTSTPKKQTTKQTKPAAPKDSKASPGPVKQESPAGEPVAPQDAKKVHEGETEESAPESKSKPILAPWAKPQEPVKKPSAPSLKEIQEREAAERKARLAQQQQQQQAALLQQAALENASASSPSSSKSPATLPSSANWANAAGSTGAAPAKTLAQIQQEEAAAAKKQAQLQPQAPSIASAIRGNQPARAASAGTVGGAWTTVGPGGRKVSQTGSTAVPSQVARPPVSANAAPVKRAVSAASTAPTAPAAVASAPPMKKSSEDFLNWCKGAITDLNPGVNGTEMLSMLLSLPASPDTKEIIADIIYANSSTMDGRRFAEEYLKRRKQADSEVPAGGESWSDVLAKQAAAASGPANDGWNSSFKVVTKKKNRKP